MNVDIICCFRFSRLLRPGAGGDSFSVQVWALPTHTWGDGSLVLGLRGALKFSQPASCCSGAFAPRRRVLLRQLLSGLLVASRCWSSFPCIRSTSQSDLSEWPASPSPLSDSLTEYRPMLAYVVALWSYFINILIYFFARTHVIILWIKSGQILSIVINLTSCLKSSCLILSFGKGGIPEEISLHINIAVCLYEATLFYLGRPEIFSLLEVYRSRLLSRRCH